VPDLDASQQAVVDHRGGPLRVVGAPGTGKTTALVEAVVARVERDGLDAGEVLVLAPTRAAAARLREQVTARLGRTVSEPLARTPASFAFGVLRQAAALRGEPAPRLISGPEQDLVLRELLAGHRVGEGAAPLWPHDVRPALATRGFRGELRDLLMRAIERGLDDEELAHLGRRHGRADWVAASQVLNEYLGVTGLATPGAYDPASIAGTAAAELDDDPDLLDRVRARARFVAVDDAHELTPASADLLRLVVGPGGPLLLVGDPDVTTQGFRGADPALLVGATDGLAAPGGEVSTLRLARSWRQGPGLRAVTRRVADRIGVVGGAAHRDVVDRPGEPPATGPGGAQVHVLRSAVHEAAFIAELLRRRHLEDDVAWSDMAVIVRGGSRSATLRRVLASAGVPVEVPATEMPVRDQPAVVPLLDAFEVGLALAGATRPVSLDVDVDAEADVDADVDADGAADFEALGAERAVDLLASPLGGADAVALRRLRRALRAEEIAGGGGRTSDELLVVALLDPALLAGVDAATAAPAHRVARVLAAGAAAAGQTGATAESVLWAIWSASRLADSWRRTALSGSASGARADRDLDAVVALFDAAARFTDRLPLARPAAFVEHLRGQEVPGDTLAERASGRDAVALVTPAGAAGLGWRVVAVAGLQEGVWPDLRGRGSLLGSQQLVDLLTGRSADPSAAVRAVRDDETRLFHLAVSRASEQLVVTAVRDEDDQPSDLLDLVDPPPAVLPPVMLPPAVPSKALLPSNPRSGEPPAPAAAATPPGAGFDPLGQRVMTHAPRPLSLPGLVARLRQAVTHPLAAADALREAEADAAAAQLARLAAAGVPGADPRDWYALAPITDDGDLRVEGPVRVSPSRVEEFERCSLRWLLAGAGGRSPSSLAQGLGNLVHEIAADLPDADTATLTAELHRRWDRLGLGSGWAADTERARLTRMIAKLGGYLADQRGTWQLVGVEQPFQAEVDVPGGPVLLTGRVDRLESDAGGRLRVVDLKTGKSAPAADDVAEHAQLGVYQVAVEHGAFTGGEPAPSAGAALVHLGTTGVKHKSQQQPPLAESADPDWAMGLLARVGAGMAGGQFPATVNETCTRCPLRSCCPATGDGRRVPQ
jgi:superfamily I DNA/RNA helicase/RecB family exonuclease